MTARLAESAPSSREPAWADYAVLVVDDEAGVRNFLQRALQARGWPPAYLEQPGAGHDEAAWAARVEPMLRFLHGLPAAR